MNKLPSALADVIWDAEGKRAEECLTTMVLDLERAGIKPKAIAKALSRVLLALCVENARRLEHYGWVYDFLADMDERMQNKARSLRRIWVRRFLERTGRLYGDARFEMRIDLPEVQDALGARLSGVDPQGRA